MKSQPGIVAFIPARGGSKGVPRKNIKDLGGQPLIAYAIATSLESKLINRVVVSTEDEEIAEIARKLGAEVPFLRPKELAEDDSPEMLTWQHAVRFLQSHDDGVPMEVFVCVPPVAPLRALEDVDSCIQLLLDSDADIVITVRPASRNPYFNMVTLTQDGFVELAIPSTENVFRRQDAPAVYDLTSVAYATRPEFILRANSLFEGNVRALLVPEQRAIDIDTELDFKIAEFLLGHVLSAEDAPPVVLGSD